jgi:hypothetical protein
MGHFQSSPAAVARHGGLARRADVRQADAVHARRGCGMAETGTGAAPKVAACAGARP